MIIWRVDNSDGWFESWHRWFAWYPVCVDCSEDDKTRRYMWVWWEWVERHAGYAPGEGPFYACREIQERKK